MKGRKTDMKKDASYNVLKKNERAYEIMLLRDRHGNTFANIANAYGISKERAKQIYYKHKTRQLYLYLNRIALTLGHQTTDEVMKIYKQAEDCYQDIAYVCAFLEKKYKAILTEYRQGEPGMPPQFVRSMPPFRSKTSKKEVARIVEMREAEKASFTKIAKELRMTPAKARHTYDWYYHEQVVELLEALQEKAASKKEMADLWDRYFKNNYSPKRRYDMLTKK